MPAAGVQRPPRRIAIPVAGDQQRPPRVVQTPLIGQPQSTPEPVEARSSRAKQRPPRMVDTGEQGDTTSVGMRGIVRSVLGSEPGYFRFEQDGAPWVAQSPPRTAPGGDWPIAKPTTSNATSSSTTGQGSGGLESRMKQPSWAQKASIPLGDPFETPRMAGIEPLRAEPPANPQPSAPRSSPTPAGHQPASSVMTAQPKAATTSRGAMPFSRQFMHGPLDNWQVPPPPPGYEWNTQEQSYTKLDKPYRK